MVVKITFLLLTGFAVVYSAPAGFDFKSILNQGQDIFQQGLKGIHEAGQSIKNHIKEGLENGHKIVEQGIQKVKDVVHKGQEVLGQGVKKGQEALDQGQKNINEAGQSVKDNYIKRGLEYVHEVVEQGIQKGKDDFHKGQNDIHESD